MSTLASATQYIHNAIKVSWATATPIDFPNQGFVAPTDGKTYWIRPVIKIPQTIAEEVGDANSGAVGLRDGLLMISIFAPKGKGTLQANKYADRLEKIFRRADIGDLWFDEPSSNPAGDDPNGYYHILMSVDFHSWTGNA